MKCGLFTIIGVMLFSTLMVALPAIAGHLEPFKEMPIPKGNPQTPEKVELGKKLFFDRRLSGDGTMSCVTCHDPEQGFTDGLAISLSYPTTRNWRNGQTLLNSGYWTLLFHDGRVRSLEEQALFPIMSAFEMNQNLDFLEERLRAVPAYAAEFQRVFGGEVTRERIAMALAAFQRTLVSVNAPLDRYLAGDKTALSKEAEKGLAVFRGKGKCAECHDGPLLSDQKFYALNVPENPELRNDPRVVATVRFVAKINDFEEFRTLTEDPGRYLITKDKKDWKAFRTPTLREVSRTAPYMHNGIFATLDEVIEFFDKGGGTGNTALKPLKLTAAEKKQLKTFMMEALAGDTLKVSMPALP